MGEKFNPQDLFDSLIAILSDCKDPTDFPYKEFKMTFTPQPTLNILEISLIVEWYGENSNKDEYDEFLEI